MQIRIKHYTFVLSSPYAEGSVLTAEEARALNVLRAENIRNAAAKTVRGLRQGDRGVMRHEEYLAARRAVTELDRGYQFRPVASARQTGSLEQEIEAVAHEAAEVELRRVDWEGEEPKLLAIERRAMELTETRSVYEEAASRLRQRQENAERALEDLEATPSEGGRNG